MSNLCREEWLGKAVDLLRPYFRERDYEIPELVKVSCGFAQSKKASGQCFLGAEVVDGVTQIYITPMESDSLKVLDILSHELVHAALPEDVKAHGKEFKKACKVLGLEGPAKQAYAGDELKKHLASLVDEERYFKYSFEDDLYVLPEYPHSKLVFKQAEEKQTTRMHKLVCLANDDHPENDIVVRASKKVTALGIPMCFCGKEFVIAEEKKEKGDA